MVRHKAQPSALSNQPGTSNSTASDSSDEVQIEVVRRPRKKRVFEEIRALRRSTKLLIPKAPFVRLVKEIVKDIFPRSKIRRFQNDAIEALREAAEIYIVQYYEQADVISQHANRTTLMQRDMVMLRFIRGRDDVINK
ncbi:uncharacterized protein LOC127278926 [Leptopilina boulardi]|uniref:uncharacterized protein LOC127278926 n=1 Tax=Leptopilina boulardi TaxID=63433 RepID=UPI0021F55C17|nr:uncharacterized protein LOC127278926 [Leptopilina boulardi]